MAGSDSSEMGIEHELLVASRPVGSLVGRSMVTVPLGASLRDAIAKLVDGDVGVVVVHDGTSAKGVISERDLIDSVHERENLDEVTVDEIMQANIISVDGSMSVVDAGRTMMAHGIRHLMVTGDHQGIVSIRAVLRSMLG